MTDGQPANIIISDINLLLMDETLNTYTHMRARTHTHTLLVQI